MAMPALGGSGSSGGSINQLTDTSSASRASSSPSLRSIPPSATAAFPPDPRAFDLSFAFNNPAYSDRCLRIELVEPDGATSSPACLAGALAAEKAALEAAYHGGLPGGSNEGRAKECDDEAAAAATAAAAAAVDNVDIGSLSLAEASSPPASSFSPSTPPLGTSSSSLQDDSFSSGLSALPPSPCPPSSSSFSRRTYDNGSFPTIPPLHLDQHPSGPSATIAHEGIPSANGSARILHVISAILVSQSDFFRSLFSPEWSQGVAERSAPVTLRLTPDEEKPFIGLMQYLYTGRLASEDPEEVLHMLLIANKFGVMSCVNVCAHHLREVPLSLDICCILLRVCSGVVLSEAAAFLVASSAAFLVNRFGNLDAMWKKAEFLDLPLEALEAVLGSDDVCVQSEETVFAAMLHWVRHHCPDDMDLRKDIVARLAEKVRFAAISAEALNDVVMAAPEADSARVSGFVMEALWFKCSSFDRQQEIMQSSISSHRRFVRRRQLSILSEVLLQDCYMLQPGQAILLAGGAWVCGKLFSLKVMRVAAPVGGSDFGLFLQASQRCPTQDKVLDDSVSVEFAFKVKEWPSGTFVQQKQVASHTFKGLFRERGYRSLLNPWNEVMKDNSRYFRNGVMQIRADLRVIQPGESLSSLE